MIYWGHMSCFEEAGMTMDHYQRLPVKPHITTILFCEGVQTFSKAPMFKGDIKVTGMLVKKNENETLRETNQWGCTEP